MLIVVAVFLCSVNAFDSKGRCLLRNLSKYIHPDKNTLALQMIELKTAQYLQSGEMKGLSTHMMEKASSNKWRYAKIGAASLGAGAVLALTGGLAAPAILAAAAVLGGSASTVAVGLGSMIAVGSVFGTAGAGIIISYHVISSSRIMLYHHLLSSSYIIIL